MKRIKLANIICVIAVLLSACTKDDVDVRDAFVGTYSETISGSIIYTISGQEFTMPINETGSFSIEKASEENQVYRVDGSDKTLGTISGNQITFSAINGMPDEDDIMLSITVTYIGSLNENTLSCTSSITGSGLISATGATFPISGSVTSIGIKQ